MGLVQIQTNGTKSGIEKQIDKGSSAEHQGKKAKTKARAVTKARAPGICINSFQRPVDLVLELQ